MKSIIILIALLISVVFIRLNTEAIAEDTSAVKSIILPVIEGELKEGAGKDETAAFCNICHSTDYITMQPRLPADTWSAIVHKMIVVYGAPVNEDDSRTIINYLSSTYGAGK
ncbi:MAG: cytochrome c [Nitrospirae bacterium]|nr:cytochrome c [Nitrospirota bacterium]